MLQKYFSGTTNNGRKNNGAYKIYEGHFTLKLFRARINKFLKEGKPLSDLLDLYACLLVVGLGDIYDEFVISDDMKVTNSCKKCYLERKIPENYAFLIDQWEETGSLYGITPEDMITYLSYNPKLTFDYVSALDCLKLQPTAIYSIFYQIMTKMGEYFRILPDIDAPVVVPTPTNILSGMDFPVLVCNYPHTLVCKRVMNSLFIFNENNKVIDAISIGTFPVYSETLNQRKNFFWRGGEEEKMLICNKYQDLQDAQKILGDNLLIRPLGETFVRSGWFMWGPDAIFAAKGVNKFVTGVDKVQTTFYGGVTGPHWYKVKDFSPYAECRLKDCVFSGEDIYTIDKLINR